MGADAFWFCDTCKIKYQPGYAGGRNALAPEGQFSDPPLTWREIDNWIKKTRKLVSKYSFMGRDFISHLGWFEELRGFLKRHEGHQVHLLNDAGGLEAGEYKDENGVIWARYLDFVSEGEPTPSKPKYGMGWHFGCSTEEDTDEQLL